MESINNKQEQKQTKISVAQDDHPGNDVKRLLTQFLYVVVLRAFSIEQVV